MSLALNLMVGEKLCKVSLYILYKINEEINIFDYKYEN